MMPTKIVCPVCDFRYLVYTRKHESFGADYFWYCCNCGGIQTPLSLGNRLFTSGITVESVNHPYPLHFTDKGVTVR